MIFNLNGSIYTYIYNILIYAKVVVFTNNRSGIRIKLTLSLIAVVRSSDLKLLHLKDWPRTAILYRITTYNSIVQEICNVESNVLQKSCRFSDYPCKVLKCDSFVTWMKTYKNINGLFLNDTFSFLRKGKGTGFTK